MAIHSYTHTTWVRLWGSGPLVESKWCHYIMIKADSHLKLLPASILDIYKVFEDIDMLSMGMAVASNSYTRTTWVRCWGSGSPVESKWHNYVIVEADSHINHCFPHPHYTYAKCLITLICCPWAYGSSLKQIPTLHYLGQILGIWVPCGVKMMSLCHCWGWQLHQTTFYVHIRHIQSVFEHIDMLSMCVWQ